MSEQGGEGAGEDAAGRLSDAERYDLHLAAVLLSLDMLRPHFARMGLSGADEAALQGLLRRHLRAFWAACEASPEAEQRFAPELVADLARATGPAFAGYFVAFCLGLLTADDDAANQAFLWKQVVSSGGLDGSRDASPPPALVIRLRQELRRRGAEERLDREAPSAWDLDVARRYGLRLGDQEEGLDPMAWAAGCVRRFLMRDAWDAATARAAGLDEEIDATLEWGRREARRLNMPPDLLSRPGWAPPPRPPPSG